LPINGCVTRRELQSLAIKKYGEFGGNVHHTWKGKPVIIFGQDESTFNQYAFGNKLWVGSNGERAFLPKHNGMGLMISAFQSREFGFGFEMTPEEQRNLTELIVSAMARAMRMRLLPWTCEAARRRSPCSSLRLL